LSLFVTVLTVIIDIMEFEESIYNLIPKE